MRRPALANQKGEVAIAILVSLVALMSGLSMSMVAHRDATEAVYQYDSVQEFSLMRSDIRRGLEVNERVDTSFQGATLPVRYIDVNSGFGRTTYAMKTKIGRTMNSGGMAPTTERTVTTLVRAFRDRPENTNFYGARNKSPIETYGAKGMRKQTFAGYMYLTNTDESVNGDEVFFYGYDELYGRVHSNSDIHLQNYPNWPVFHGHVSTSGHILPSEAPFDEIFLDGYTEEAPEIDFNGTMAPIRQHGIPMFDDVDIASITLQGPSFKAQLAHFDELPLEELVIYDLYPPYGPVGDSIGVNYIAFTDTIWTEIIMNCPDGTTVHSLADEMWIKGVCLGAQTWGSEGNVKLSDDITYFYTPIGEAPDGADGTPRNQSDYLGIVSAQKIFVQYGYKDPDTDERLRPNCGPTYDDGIYIYAALAALGDGHGDAHEDGVFSFEYQYVHESTPDCWYNGEFFDNIDLHMCAYPPQDPPFWPWPAKGGGGYSYAGMTDPEGPDYPWYNPLWPEELPIRERGTIHLYGSLAQQRRGFVHRGGEDPLDTGWWDMDNHRYGPVTTYGLNVLGTPGNKDGIGYDKDYHYDHRFITNPPPNFPEVNIVGGQGMYEDIALRVQRPPSSF